MWGLAFHHGISTSDRRRVSVVLAVAILAISSSAVLVRGMEATPLAIAAWRTFGAAVVLSPALVRARGTLSRRDTLWLVLAGLVLALHFWSWVTSLALTTVLRSTVLVCLVPIWTAGLDFVLWRRVPTRGLWIGLAIALPGLAILAGDGGQSSLAGDALAILAGVLWAVDLAIQSRVRQRVSSTTTMGVACVAASALLFTLAAVTGTPVAGWPSTTWLLLLAAVLGPQLVGHQGISYALRWVPASTVATVALLEPVGASALAAILLGEHPGSSSIVGGVLVLLGVAVAARSPTVVSNGRTVSVVG